MLPQIRIGCRCAQEGPNPGAGAQILETLRGCKVERKEPEASPASMVSCSTPRFPSSPALFFGVFYGVDAAPLAAATLPCCLPKRGCARRDDPVPCNPRPRHGAKEKRGRRTIRNQRSHLHATGSRSPGGCSLCQRSLPSLLLQLLEGGAGLLPKIP